MGRVRAVGAAATRLAPGDWVFCDLTGRARDKAMTLAIMLSGLIAPRPSAQCLQARSGPGSFAEQPLENAFRLGDLDAAAAARWCA